jgi:hypothetical protein
MTRPIVILWHMRERADSSWPEAQENSKNGRKGANYLFSSVSRLSGWSEGGSGWNKSYTQTELQELHHKHKHTHFTLMKSSQLAGIQNIMLAPNRCFHRTAGHDSNTVLIAVPSLPELQRNSRHVGTAREQQKHAGLGTSDCKRSVTKKDK